MSEITGVIKLIRDTQVISDKFKKREFVITTDGDYPQPVQLELTQDNVSKIDSYKVGDKISVAYNIRGNEWTKDDVTRYFNSLQAWKIDKVSGTVANNAQVEDDNQDLPF